MDGGLDCTDDFVLVPFRTSLQMKSEFIEVNDTEDRFGICVDYPPSGILFGAV